MLLEAINFRDVSTTSNKFKKLLTIPEGISIVEDVKEFNVNIITSKYSVTTLSIS